jgi:light-regulated signal transduction histidine kinase (bacteriophytochrome)
MHDPTDQVAALQREVERLRQANTELETANAELEKLTTELDAFAFAVANDLRAPLRGITTLASWIDEDLPATTDAVTKDHLHQLTVRAARMDALIDGLLELARVGRVRQAPARVDVTELLHEVIVRANPREASRIMMIGELPMLVTDRAALHQVFSHLVRNALQHAGRDDVVVRISAIDRGEAWELVVADNGVGIGPDHRVRVWQPFHTEQAREATDAVGMGLAIARKQVERHGGRIWIDDDGPGTGATLRFTWAKRTK